MSFVARAFTGHYRLWQIFWLYGLLPAAIVVAVAYFVVQASPELLAPVAIVLFLYGLWWIISVWRSAFLCDRKIWSYAARLLCAALLIVMTGGIVIALKGDLASTEATVVADPVVTVTEAMEVPATEASPVLESAPAVNPAEEACKEKLRAYAAANNADADAYVAQNQAWVDSCVKKAAVQP